MADANIRAVITAEDRASAVVGGFSSKLEKSFAQITAVTIAAGLALDRFTGFLASTVDAANKNQAALTGLNSVAKAFGQNADEAKNAAKSLAKDGLLSVTDAATGLKNLLASGFSLPQAVELLKRFKDSAAFGRQSALSFGQAVTSATEGIKNGNSILVDNAGVTKNLSLILQEAGFSAQDLMRATTDATVRQALFNGILKETNPQLGDAARLSEQYAGQQSKLNAQLTVMKERIGAALQPALLGILTAITPIVEKISKWVLENPKLASTIVIATVAFLGIVAVLGAIGTVLAAAISLFGVLGGVVGVGIAIAVAAVVAFGAAVLINFQRARDIVGGFIGFMASAFKGVVNIITTPFREGFNLIIKMINAIASKVPGLGGFRIPQIPALAQGTPNFQGGLALVGEQGPELVNLPRGSSVTPNNKMANTTINISINAGAFTGTPTEARKFARTIADNLKDVANAKNMTAAQMLGA